MTDAMDDELARLLAAFTEVYARKVDLWRVYVPARGDPDQTPTRVYRGSFEQRVPPEVPGTTDSQT